MHHRTHAGRGPELALTLSVLILGFIAPPATGQEASPSTAEEPTVTSRAGYDEVPSFGGPSSTPEQLTEDDEPKTPVYRFDGMQRFLAPYFEFKARQLEENGLSLGADYTALYQHASVSPHDAAGGIFRLFGLKVVTRGENDSTGSIIFKGEHRGKLGTDGPPSGLGFDTGYVGLTAAPYNDAGWWLTNLYWQQRNNGGKLNFVLGHVDATDYLDVYGLVNPWTQFTNLAFITGSGTIPLPNQGLGGAVGAMLSNNLYVVAGLTDSNGDPGSPGKGFETLFQDHETFKHLELGWTPSFEQRYLDNTHITFWQVDERTDAGVPDGWGVNGSWTRFIDERWLPFIRGGYSNDGGALLERSVSVGLGHYMSRRSDLFGAGLNWGKPSSDFGSGLSDQYTAEVFYRLQFSENFAITPDLQWIVDPALAPTEDHLLILGVRARLSI